MRTGHLPLNDYLHKRKLTPSPNCTACPDERKETLEHILKECPAYKKQRTKLKKALQGRSISNYPALLSDPKRVKSVIIFMEETKRWTTGYMKNPNRRINSTS